MTTSASVLDKAAERRAKYIKGLRELIALFESNPDLPTPPTYTPAVVTIYADDRDGDEKSIAAVAKMADRLGVELKYNGGGHFKALLTLPSGAQYEFLYITRERMEHHSAWADKATAAWNEHITNRAVAVMTPDDPALPKPPADRCPSVFDDEDDVTRWTCVRDAGHAGIHWSRDHRMEWGSAEDYQTDLAESAEPVHHAAAFRHVEWWGWSCACGVGVPDGLTEVAAKAAATDHVESVAVADFFAEPDVSGEVGRALCADGIHEADFPCCPVRAAELAAFDEPQPSSVEAGIADEATGVEL